MIIYGLSYYEFTLKNILVIHYRASFLGPLLGCLISVSIAEGSASVLGSSYLPEGR